MAEGSESPSDGVVSPRPNRLHQALAWVGIIAGGLFIVGVVFASGLYAGMAADGHRGWFRPAPAAGPGGSMECPMMRQGGMPAPGGMMGPGRGSPPSMPPG